MDDIPLSVLLVALLFLILVSAFFSGSETGLMTLNRYRLRHLADQRHPGAMRAQKLLQRQDRLIGLILLGNNLANILASILMTLIALRIRDDAGFVFASGMLLTVVVLLFAEVTPKTLAALRPESIAFPSAYVYVPLMWLMYPFVWAVNGVANGLLRLIGVSPEDGRSQALTREELRSVVMEAGAMIPERHQSMLLNIIDLEKVTVEDIMVPRNEITGIDINEDVGLIVKRLGDSQYTRMPLYQENVDHVLGILHMRDILPLLYRNELDHEALRRAAREPYFIPESTTLNRQLLNFQHMRRRIGFAVDEYGDIQGLVTMEDILEEIVGEFTSDPSAQFDEILPQEDGTWLVDGSVSIRTLNSALRLSLPIDGPKTLNGLIIEHLEMIPEASTSLLLGGHPVDILQIRENMIKTVRIHPPWQGPDRPDTAPGQP